MEPSGKYDNVPPAGPWRQPRRGRPTVATITTYCKECFMHKCARFGLVFSLFAASIVSVSALADEADLDRAYRQAVVDAAFPNAAVVTSNLVAIQRGNPNLVWNADGSKLLVVTWKSQSGYDNFIKPATATSASPDYAVWVTAAPQVKRFCAEVVKTGADKDKLNLRLKQYLGLDRAWNYDVFVEMWVDPADLFRPCVDPETSDSVCNLQFGGSVPTVKNIPDYKSYYSGLYFKSFRGSAGVPWTGLGYTYDWGSPNRVGASEFILAPGSHYEVKAATPTSAYCAP